MGGDNFYLQPQQIEIWKKIHTGLFHSPPPQLGTRDYAVIIPSLRIFLFNNLRQVYEISSIKMCRVLLKNSDFLHPL